MTAVRSQIIKEVKRRLELAGFFVSRKIIKLADMREDQLPGISLLNGPQTDEPASQDGDALATWDLQMILSVKDVVTETPQETIDESMALCSRTLLEGRNLSGLAYSIDSLSRDTDRGVFYPFASAEMFFRIKFFFDRETQGG